MFNKNFYPTPTNVIAQMVEALGGYLWILSKSILDPSAGKGDILDYITKTHATYRSPKNIVCFEIEPELQAILWEKGYKVIGKDFLTEPCHYQVDCIIMNPPFDNADEHLLKAFDTVRSGGKVCCLLNSETLNNPHTRQRKALAQVIEKHGTVTELGQCFKGSQRATSVFVSMVVLEKPQTEDYTFEGEFTADNIHIPEGLTDSTALELTDPLRNREHRFNAAIEHFKNVIREVQLFKRTYQGLFDRNPDKEFSAAAWEGNFNAFYSYFNELCWQGVLNTSKFQTYLTSKTQEKFISNFNRQKDVAFTKENMMEMFDLLINNSSLILNDCLVEVFDYMTRYYRDNREYIEYVGWATNSAYKVNMKVILPSFIKWGEYTNESYLKSVGSKFTLNWSNKNNLEDIDRAMCYLTGKKFASEGMITIVQGLDKAFNTLGNVCKGAKFTNTAQSTFFKMQFYKCGTLHLTFKDKLLWEWFNCAVAEIKGYPLPEAQTVYKRAKTLKI